MTLAEALYDALTPLNDPDPDGALQTWCEQFCAPVERIWERLAETEDQPGWAVLFDADNCPAYALPWLAQFVGVRIEDQWSEQEIRDAIKTPTGWKRGTPAAMITAAAATLTGAKSVGFIERSGGDAYALAVRTLTSETPDPAGTEAAIRRQKPIGIILDYQAIAGQTYLDVDADFSSYTALEAAYDDYFDLATTA